MKSILLPTLLAFASGVGAAQEVGRVISATSVVQQIGVPREVCTTPQVWSDGPKSGAGAAMGAIAGGALGHAVKTATWATTWFTTMRASSTRYKCP